MFTIFKMSRRIFTLLVAACIVIVQTLLPVTANAYTARLYGTDRYRTAIAISQQGWSNSYYAVLARGDDFPDALCAGPLAKTYNAPILLTEPWRLNPDVLTELKRLGVSYVYIIGGPGAVSQNVEYSLRSAGISSIERIYGSDRYDTSVRIAERMGWPGTIALATGENFPDALSISAIASKKGMPILLTGRYNLPYSVDQYIRNRSINKTYVVGGVGVISEGIRTTVPNAVRLAGTDRFDTNVQIMQHFADELDFNNLYVAIGDGPTGDEFADALTGAVLAAKTSSPLILTGSALPWVTSNYIRPKVSSITKVTALGGEGVVPWSVVNSITNNTGYNYTGGQYTNISATYNTAGTYGPYNGTNTVSGSVVISANDVTLQNTIIEGDLTLTENIYTGSVYLRNVTVRGTTYVRGGGPNSVVMTDFNTNYMIADVPNNTVRLMAQGYTNIGHLRMECGGRLEEYNLSGNGFATVVIPDSVSVTMYGRFDTVYMESRSANLYLESGSINTLNVSSAAPNSYINVESDAFVDTMTLDASTTVYGQGQIYRANINSSGTYIEKSPSTTVVRYGIWAKVGGQDVTGTSSSSSSQTYTVSLSAASGTINIDAYDSFSAHTNINNPDSASLSYTSNNSNVTVVNGVVTSSVPGASALITVKGNKSGWNEGTTSFTVNVSSNTAKVSDSGELTGALGNSNISTIKLASDITSLTSAINVNRAVTVDGQDKTINAGINITGNGAVIKDLNITMSPSSPATTLTTALFGSYESGSRRAAVWVNGDNVKLQNTTLNITDSSSIYGTDNTIGQGISVNQKSNVEISNCSITMHDTNIVGSIPQYSKEFIGIYLSHSLNATVTTNTVAEGAYGIGVDVSGGSTPTSFALLNNNVISNNCAKAMYIVGDSINTDYNAVRSFIKVPGNTSGNSAEELIVYFKNNNTAAQDKLYTYMSSDKSINKDLKVSSGGIVQQIVNVSTLDELQTALSSPSVVDINITSGITATGTVIQIPDRALTISSDITRTVAVLNVTKANPSSSLTLTNVNFEATASTGSQLNSALSGIANSIRLSGEINDLAGAISVARPVVIEGNNHSINAGLNITTSSVSISNLDISMTTTSSTVALPTGMFGSFEDGARRAVVWVNGDNVKLNDLDIDLNDYAAGYKVGNTEYGQGIAVNGKANVEITNCTVSMNDSEDGDVSNSTYFGIYLYNSTDTKVTSNTVSKALYGVGVDVTTETVSFKSNGLNNNTIEPDCTNNMMVIGRNAITYGATTATINTPGESGVSKSALDLMQYFSRYNSYRLAKNYRYESADGSNRKDMTITISGSNYTVTIIP